MNPNQRSTSPKVSRCLPLALRRFIDIHLELDASTTNEAFIYKRQEIINQVRRSSTSGEVAPSSSPMAVQRESDEALEVHLCLAQSQISSNNVLKLPDVLDLSKRTSLRLPESQPSDPICGNHLCDHHSDIDLGKTQVPEIRHSENIIKFFFRMVDREGSQVLERFRLGEPPDPPNEKSLRNSGRKSMASRRPTCGGQNSGSTSVGGSNSSICLTSGSSSEEEKLDKPNLRRLDDVGNAKTDANPDLQTTGQASRCSWPNIKVRELLLKPNEAHHLVFCWKRPAQTVEIAGSFTNPPWELRCPLAWCPNRRYFWIDIYEAFPHISGYHQFKYVVDGNWVCDITYPVADDGHGNLNNIVIVFPESVKRANQQRQNRKTVERLYASSPSLILPKDSKDSSSPWLRRDSGSNKMYVISKQRSIKPRSSILCSSSPEIVTAPVQNGHLHRNPMISQIDYLGNENVRFPIDLQMPASDVSSNGEVLRNEEMGYEVQAVPAGDLIDEEIEGNEISRNSTTDACSLITLSEKEHSRSSFDLEPEIQDSSGILNKPSFQEPLGDDVVKDALRRVFSYSAQIWPSTVTDHLHSPEILLELQFPDLRETKNLTMNSGAVIVPHPKKKKGADSLFICDAGRAVGVADGVGEWDSWGLDPRKFAEELMSGCCASAHSDACKNISDVEKRCDRIISEGFELTESFGSATVLVATLNEEDGVLGVANLGDSTLVVLRRLRVSGMFEVIYRTKELQHQFNCPYQLARLPPPSQYESLMKEGKEHLVRVLQSSSVLPQDTPEMAITSKVSLLEGDLIILGTDGLFDNLFEHEITSLMNLALSPYEAMCLMELHMTTPAYIVATALAEAATFRSRDSKAKTPFMRNARLAGTHYHGGKIDDITVLASWVTRKSHF
eukprot:GHVP01001051.1.p1 GENE.GHVP01001051.1~~GHVP01001051.1.p1  ORF type:complete len:898 (-),score=140.81 GHVP01001051.1:3566-6259(-)